MPKVSRVLFLAALLLAAFPAQARLNLPQTKLVVTVPENVVRMVLINLGVTGAAPDLQLSAQKLLLSILPEDLRGACSEMIEPWGESAKGTAVWSVRTLHHNAGQAWLAFRCGSSAPDYRQYYDERLAILSPGVGKLEFFPLGPNAENDSTLYHLEFFGGVLLLEGALGAALEVKQPGENPCCDGGDTTTLERWVVFADSTRGVWEALSVVTREDHYSHDDENGDVETLYEAKVNLEPDSQGFTAFVNVTFHEEVKVIEWKGGTSEPHTTSTRDGTLHYHWNTDSFKFEEIKQ